MVPENWSSKAIHKTLMQRIKAILTAHAFKIIQARKPSQHISTGFNQFYVKMMRMNAVYATEKNLRRTFMMSVPVALTGQISEVPRKEKGYQ
jgi:hypothetical protein